MSGRGEKFPAKRKLRPVFGKAVAVREERLLRHGWPHEWPEWAALVVNLIPRCNTHTHTQGISLDLGNYISRVSEREKKARLIWMKWHKACLCMCERKGEGEWTESLPLKKVRMFAFSHYGNDRMSLDSLIHTHTSKLTNISYIFGHVPHTHTRTHITTYCTPMNK